MGVQIQTVASCTGYVFVSTGSVYHKSQEPTGNWTPFEPTDPDHTWPGVSLPMSAATYQNPEGLVGYVAVAGVDGQLYIGAPARSVSGPLVVPPLPPMQPYSILATDSYIMYFSSDSAQIALIDFAQIMGIVPSTNSVYQVLQAPGSFQSPGPLTAAKDSEGLWEICGTLGTGLEIVRLVGEPASVRWSHIPLDVEGWPFGLYLCGEALYMFLTDSEQIWVKRALRLKLPRQRDAEYLWEAAHLLPSPPQGTFDLQPATIIVAPGEYFMLFTIDGDGGLWRLQYGGTSNSNTWEYVGFPTEADSIRPSTLAVSIGTTGNVELFAASDAGDLWQMWHTTETGVWSDWYFHGRPAD